VNDIQQTTQSNAVISAPFEPALSEGNEAFYRRCIDLLSADLVPFQPAIEMAEHTKLHSPGLKCIALVAQALRIGLDLRLQGTLANRLCLIVCEEMI
jgi:hypothetical protein